MESSFINLFNNRRLENIHKDFEVILIDILIIVLGRVRIF